MSTYVVFQATRGRNPVSERGDFTATLAQSSLANSDSVAWPGAADSPVSTKADTKNKRYQIADPYLRFWLAFLERGLPIVERGRGDLLLERIERSWTSWRGPPSSQSSASHFSG